MSRAEAACFHCGEPVPPGSSYVLEHDGRALPMCCAGCLAVSSLIFDSGLDRYYRFRESLARRADADLERLRAAWRSCDTREALWGDAAPDGTRDLLLQTEGINCAACAWLIRSQLGGAPGVRDVQVDTASGYTNIRWSPDETRLSDIALRLGELGYRPHLPLAAEEERARREERRRSLKRLGVAGLGMMQVMMYAVALYAGDYQGMPVAAERFLEWVSLVVTTPVVLYSARGFFEGAWRSLRARRPGMDVPVSLAIGVAFTASCVNFLRGSGEVWFDSVVMFVFFLLVGRHVEMVLRQRNQQAGAVLARLLPEWAERLTPEGPEAVPASDLVAGDRVRVREGEAFPADGVIDDGATHVDEALLTGESHPLARGQGDRVIAGSLNVSQPVGMRVEAVGTETTVSALGRLLRRARASRSHSTVLSERFATVFVLAVLVIASLSGAWWWMHDRDMVMPVVLSVLVVSCPCALSLATPAAVAVASRRLLREGIILARGTAIEEMVRVDHVVFDKTGTLTTGEPVVAGVHLNPRRPDWSAERALAVAAALEAGSSHPVARAFRGAGAAGVAADALQVVAGKGVRGEIDGAAYRIGASVYAGPGADEVGEVGEGEGQGTWLADEAGWIARFDLSDRLREDARATVDAFREAGLGVEVLSGDHPAIVRGVAEALGITAWAGHRSPEDKLARIEVLRREGRTVLMIGDGVNDAPVLAAADVSIAVQGGAELANAAADLILTGNELLLAPRAREIAGAARRILRQNLSWAVAYNASAIPLAFTGHLEPWMAALGMSASSLLVVLNSARLARRSPRVEDGGAPAAAGEAGA